MDTCTCTHTMMDFLSNAAWLSSLFLNELTDVHDVLREFIPYVDDSLAKEMFLDV